MSPLPLLLALLAFTLSWRWRGAHRSGRIALVAAGVAFALIGVGVITLPSMEEIVTEVGGRLGRWTYAVVAVSAFLETGAFLGFVAPGETMVLFGGVMAGAGTVELGPLIALVWASAFLGDVCAYMIGRRYGRGFLLRHGERVKIGEPQVQFVERFFERHGHATVLLGRWIGVVRPLVPFLAGSSRLPAVRFLAVDFVAAGLWSAGLAALGAVFWRNFDELTSLVGQALFGFGTLLVVGTAFGFAIAARRSEQRSADVDAWVAEQLTEHAFVGRPAAAVWALIDRVEPKVPGRKARRGTPAAAGTVSQDDASATSAPPDAHHHS